MVFVSRWALNLMTTQIALCWQRQTVGESYYSMLYVAVKEVRRPVVCCGGRHNRIEKTTGP